MCDCERTAIILYSNSAITTFLSGFFGGSSAGFCSGAAAAKTINKCGLLSAEGEEGGAGREAEEKEKAEKEKGEGKEKDEKAEEKKEKEKEKEEKEEKAGIDRYGGGSIPPASTVVAVVPLGVIAEPFVLMTSFSDGFLASAPLGLLLLLLLLPRGFHSQFPIGQLLAELLAGCLEASCCSAAALANSLPEVRPTV